MIEILRLLPAQCYGDLCFNINSETNHKKEIYTLIQVGFLCAETDYEKRQLSLKKKKITSLTI